MTLAVMTRASRGHTGLELRASPMTMAAYVAVVLAGVVRPLTAAVPDLHLEVLGLSGALWIAAFLLFALEYGPVLSTKRKEMPASRRSM